MDLLPYLNSSHLLFSLFSEVAEFFLDEILLLLLLLVRAESRLF